jgi:hypothetical protein
VGLDQHGIDLLEVHGLGLGADGFEQAGDGQISGLADDALGRPHNQVKGFLRTS